MNKGLIIKATGSRYIVRKDDGEQVACQLKGRLRTEYAKSTNPVVVGDRVVLESGVRGEWLIGDIEERRNYLVRKATNLSRQSHIIAANVDMALLVVTFRMPETPSEFIDRFLVAAEAYRIPVCIVFNKTDLYGTKEQALLQEALATYGPIGYQTLQTSVATGEGIDDFRALLAEKVSALAGLSGVGKSSLIAAAVPGLNVRVGAISDYHRSGKHTTTFAEMLDAGSGGYIIDTPGIRGFGLVHINREEIWHFFPEIFKMAANCAFHNCLHVKEPNCAVREAVERDEISAGRYRSYLSMVDDTQDRYRTNKYE